MRVIAGIAKGRTLFAPRGDRTRPTSDKVRGAIFNILAARGLPSIEGASVLDLYAGTGAFGIEALSRGAAHATFVEKDRAALDSIRRNLDGAGFGELARVVAGDADGAIAHVGTFDLVFADPPYAVVARSKALKRLETVLAPGGLAVVEHEEGDPPPDPPGLVAADRRRYGSTAVTFYERPATT